MSGKPPLRRRRFVVDRKLQFKYILLVVLVSLVVGLVAEVLFYTKGTQEISEAYYTAHRQIKHTKEIFLPGLMKASVVALVLLALAGARGLFVSHRVAGPVFRFKQNVKEIGAGDLTLTTRIRERDEFHDLAESLSEMTEALRVRAAKAQAAAREARALCEELGEVLPADNAPASDCRSRLRAKLDELGAELEGFKTANKT